VIDKTHHTGAMPPFLLRDNGLCTKTRRLEALRHGSKFPLYVEAYHLASSPIRNQHFPFQTRKSSVMGAINMLGRTKPLHACVLQAPTRKVYRDANAPSQPEHYRGRVNVNGWRQANVAFARAGNALCGAETGTTEP
jgi:UDP-glucuronate decarboxylase